MKTHACKEPVNQETLNPQEEARKGQLLHQPLDTQPYRPLGREADVV